jgi:hypothetical protein
MLGRYFINEVACYRQEMGIKSKHMDSNESIREFVAHNRQQKIEVQWSKKLKRLPESTILEPHNSIIN